VTPLSTEAHPARIGRYEIQKPLGSGAMGDVFLAHDPNIGRLVAIKTVRVIGGNDEDIADRRGRLLREARAAGKFQHPNVVALYDAGEADGLLYLAFEYVPGQDVLKRARQSPEMTLREVLRVVRETASALEYAQQENVVHRDIKPSNILLGPKGIAKVADFGIAKLTDQSVELTRTGSVVGSPQYMSPEQIRGEELDGRSDLFSLGVVLYELLSRMRPFGGDTISTLVFEILGKEPMPIESLRPGLPQGLVQLVRSMLVKDRNHRIADAAQVVHAIEALERSLSAAELDRPASQAAGADMQPTQLMPSGPISGTSAAIAPPGAPTPPPMTAQSSYPGYGAAPPYPTGPQPYAPTAGPTGAPTGAGAAAPTAGGPPSWNAPPPPPSMTPPPMPAPMSPPPMTPPPMPYQAAPQQPPQMAQAYGNLPPRQGPPAVKPTSPLKLLLLLGAFGLFGLIGAFILFAIFGDTTPTPPASTTEAAAAPGGEEPPPPPEEDNSEAADDPSGQAAYQPTATVATAATDDPAEPAWNEPRPTAGGEPTREEPIPQPTRREPTTTAPSSGGGNSSGGGALARLGEAIGGGGAQAPDAGNDDDAADSGGSETSPSPRRRDPRPEPPPTASPWDEAAASANSEIETGLRFQFKVSPADAMVLFWRNSDRRAVVQGPAGDFDPKKDEEARVLELPSDGEYLLLIRHGDFPEYTIRVHADRSRGSRPKLLQFSLGRGGSGASTGSIRVSKAISFAGTPGDAYVFVDGRSQGRASDYPGGNKRSDKNLKLDRGKHVVRIEARGFKPYEVRVEVGSGAPAVEQINYRLEKE